MQRLRPWTLTTVILIAMAWTSPSSAAAPPKNIIIMIADGCGYGQVEAARYYLHGGDPFKLFDGFTLYGVATYSATGRPYDPEKAWSDPKWPLEGATDSAASATALSTGTVTANGRIGTDSEGRPLEHIAQRAEKHGKASGVVTSVMLCHATPAGFSAHNDSRGKYEDISKEMFETSGLEVVMGAGHPYYDTDGKRLPAERIDEERFRCVGGRACWETILAGKAVGDADGDGAPDPWTLVDDRAAFQKLAEGETPKRVLGIAPIEATLQQGRKGDTNAAPYAVPLLETSPTLAEMTRAALNVLDNNPNGLFLMVEGGAVDWASHANQTGRMLEEMAGFWEAIEAVKTWVEKSSSWNETLLIVTGDHETGWPGGPKTDGTYGPIEDRGRGNVPDITWRTKGHTNNLIPLYVRGCGAERFADCVRGTDPKRGPYLHSSDVGKTMHGLWP